MKSLIPFGKSKDLVYGGLFDLDNLFDDFLKGSFSGRLLSQAAKPLIDLYEKGSNLIVKAELPGIAPEELDVSIDGNFLTIKGEKKQENEVKEKDYYRVETSYGSFQRTIELPLEVDSSQARATYNKGVLQIELPKSEQAKKKQIKIEVN